MSSLFPVPFYTFIKIVIRNGGFTGKGLLHAALWLMKTVILEPHRWVESLEKNKTISEHISIL